MEVSDVMRLAQAPADDDPRAALAAALGLHHEADRTEAAAARRARVSGLAWADFAARLGASKQAVNQKYGRR